MAIDPQYIGQRLDRAAGDIFPELAGFSRTKVQDLIKDGAITVNGIIKSPHYILKPEDETKIDRSILQITNYELTISPDQIAEPLKIPDVPIIAETDDYIILDKPSGLTVHPGESVKDPTLADWLVERYPRLRQVGEDPARPGIVHRLDKEVSGLMVIAKNADTFDLLKDQFQKRTISKEYTALAYGSTSKDYDTISFPIERSASGKMSALPSTVKGETNPDGRNALTEFEVARRFVNYTLLKVRIKTGRTHQIRVHMSAYGHPLVGDDLYSTHKTRLANQKLKLGRIFLAATKLAFYDRNGEKQEFTIDLPAKLKALLQQIK